jgi:STE24 endopeptidase
VIGLLRSAGPGTRPLLLAAGAVAVGVAVAVLLSTPWQPLDAPAEAVVPADPARDFTAAEQAEEDAFHAAVRPPAYLGLALGLGATALAGLSPLGARLVRRLPSPRAAPVLVPAVVGGLLVLAAVRLLTLPLAAWQESVRLDYGLSTRDWGGWASDVLRGFAVQSVLTLLAVVAIVLLARRWPQRWWLVAAPGAAGLVVVTSLAYPLVVEPVFNRFEPLPDGELRSSLVALAAAEGVEVGDVLVADASRRTTALNAYVSGLGPTKRVVLYDTLLQTAPADEIELVVAHELAHAREGDVVSGTLLGAGGAALAVLLVALGASWRPVTAAAGVDGPSGGPGAVVGQAAAVPLLLALLGVLGVVGSPAEAVVSRQVEARADAVALDLTRDPATFTRMQRTLAVEALSDLDPPPALHWWFGSHPTAPARIAMARTWAAVNGVEEPPNLAPPPARPARPGAE